MKTKHIMSKREEVVMEHLWRNGKPMMITELEEIMVEDGLSKASIFKAVQALTKCGYINVSGVELVGRTYLLGYTYSDDDFLSEALSLLEGIKDETIKKVLLAQIKAASAL